MKQQTKEQISVAIVAVSCIAVCILIQSMYIRIKNDEKVIQGFERRAEKANHVIDSLEATNAQRMLEIDLLNQQLERNTEIYEANINAIDSLDRNGLRRAMHSLLAELAGERYPGQSND